jgi:hypothetical protein
MWNKSAFFPVGFEPGGCRSVYSGQDVEGGAACGGAANNSVPSDVSTGDGTDMDARTTVQLRNLPADFTRNDLLKVLDANMFYGLYNFVYLPMDFTHNTSLGYAIINLLTPEAAAQLQQRFSGFSAWPMPSDNICEASWSEQRQTLEEHIERYRNSPVMHPGVPEQHKPALFENGQAIAFPAPTKHLRRPRVRHVKGAAVIPALGSVTALEAA